MSLITIGGDNIPKRDNAIDEFMRYVAKTYLHVENNASIALYNVSPLLERYIKSDKVNEPKQYIMGSGFIDENEGIFSVVALSIERIKFAKFQQSQHPYNNVLDSVNPYARKIYVIQHFYFECLVDEISNDMFKIFSLNQHEINPKVLAVMNCKGNEYDDLDAAGDVIDFCTHPIYNDDSVDEMEIIDEVSNASGTMYLYETIASSLFNGHGWWSH